MKNVKTLAPLAERTTWTPGTHSDKCHAHTVGSNYTASLSRKEIAATVRAELRRRFPEIKFSVTSGDYSVNARIVSTPYGDEATEAVKGYASALLQSYNYDDSDSQTDYFDVNFYGDASIEWNAEHREPTEEERNAEQAFAAAMQAKKEAEEAEREAEFERWKAEEDAARKIHEAQEAKRLEEVAQVEAAAVVRDLAEGERYTMQGMSRFCKFNSLEEIGKNIDRREGVEALEIRRTVTLTDNAVQLFARNLLSDFSFLKDQGGSYTEDERVQSFQDFQRMTPDERDTVEWITWGVAILGEAGQFLFAIDPEGYSYARYTFTDAAESFRRVGRSTEAQQKADVLEDVSSQIILTYGLFDAPWEKSSLYLEEMRHHLDGLTEEVAEAVTIPRLRNWLLARLNQSNDPTETLQATIKAADLQEGQRVTVFCMSDFGMLETIQAVVQSVELRTWAQYADAVKLVYRVPGGRKDREKWFTSTSDLCIVDGFEALPHSVQWTAEQPTGTGARISSGKYMAFDHRYMEDARAWLAEAGLTVLVDWANREKPSRDAQDNGAPAFEAEAELPDTMDFDDFVRMVTAKG